MDWANDPELSKIRYEFIESLKERVIELQELMEKLGHKPILIEEPLRSELYTLSHSLSGSAATFELKKTAAIAEKLENLVSQSTHNIEEIISTGIQLCKSLTSVFESRDDVPTS